MSEYDARGKDNRALLICVSDYLHLPELPAVKDNAEQLERVLTAPGTDLFTDDEVVICRPKEPWELERALDAVTKEARGLLLVHFSGHGRVGPDGGDLQLMVGGSAAKGGHKTVSWQDLVLSYLGNARADRIVIVLECCYAGNAGEAFHSSRTPMSLLMAAQPNRRIFSGEEPAGGTLFTRAAVQILERGIPGKTFVTFEDLVRALRDRLAGEETPMGDVWEPRSAKQNTVDDVILSFATPEVRPRTPLRIRLRRWWKVRILRWRRVLMVFLTALVLLTAGVVARNAVSAPPACPPALELRLLTAPEAEPTLRSAAFSYEMSDLNTRPLQGERDLPDGCRRAQITVYSAAKDQVDEGFAAADRWQGEAHGANAGARDAKGADPLHRPGPQPDLWIPESTADYEEARRVLPGGSPATLHNTGPVAYSPLVVGIPADKRLDDVERVGASWKDLLTGTDSAHRDLELLRPSPVLSGTGLLHTIGLYLAGDGSRIGPAGTPDRSLAQDAESRLSAPGSQYAGSTELLCSLRRDKEGTVGTEGTDGTDGKDGRSEGGAEGTKGRAGTAGRGDRSAPLVSEKSLVDYNLGHPVGSCPALDTALAPGDRYAAYYPKNVPALDHPLVRVDWSGADDATPRQAATDRFAGWLRDPGAGQHILVGQGYRGVPDKDGEVPRPEPGSPLLNTRSDADPAAPVIRYTAGGDQVSRVLDRYDKAQKSSQLLILFDTSTSMADGGRLPVAVGAADRTLEMVGAHHTYGLWTFPDPAHPTDPAAVHRAVPLGSAAPAPGKAVLDRIAKGGLVAHGAAMEEALTAAVRELKDSAGANKAVVLIVDQDDGAPRRAAGVEQTLNKLLKGTPEVPVLTLVMGKAGCDTLAFQGLADASGGQCVPAGPTAPDLLAGLVASVGTAGKEDR
ncbi:caspase family protein [Streptomyces sp. NPDC091266]|uniref:caspase family protein n=1 Tax=Streptomyces sp. NPDC091266 TaxID=3365978 RepID=UPI00382B63AC